VQLEVPTGLHKLLWNYHQEISTGYAIMSNILVQGTDEGIGGLSLPCPVGQFSNDASAINCSVCVPGTYSPVDGSSACASCIKDNYNPNYGASECIPCDEGSSTVDTGSTQCQTSCIFNVPTGDTFDLTGLSNTVTVYDTSRRKYLINVCKNVGDPCADSHSCIVNLDGSVTAAGNSFRFELDQDNSSAVPFSIFFEHGDSCSGSATVQRATSIQFECDTESPSNIPNFINEDPNCLATFSWRSTLACRKCTDSDYTIVRGVCSGGHRKMSKTRISPCNGAASLAIPDEKCSDTEFPLAAILVVVFVFVGVVAVAAFIFFRNRRLAARYASLVEETRTSNISI